MARGIVHVARTGYTFLYRLLMLSRGAVYEALLLLSFGGPEGPDDVLPFLHNVTRGRNVPEARLAAVAAQYERFGGVSPINASCRALVRALSDVTTLPIYWGNRNWTPYLADTVAQMAADGITRAACFVTSAYSGYSACRQYCDDIAGAQAAVGPSAPRLDKLRPYFNHPGFVETVAENVTSALATLDPRVQPGASLVFSAHSVPLDQPEVETYVAQVTEASRLVAAIVDRPWSLCWQSRSGPPSQPWLEPDIGDHLRSVDSSAVVVVPVGFVADHMEVVYDLDVVALGALAARGLPAARAATVGTARAFVAMIGELVAERSDPTVPRRAVGTLPPVECDLGCCC